MNPFFAYLIKSSVSLVLLYSLYRLIMRNDRTHALNRFLLLGILMSTLLFNGCGLVIKCVVDTARGNRRGGTDDTLAR